MIFVAAMACFLLGLSTDDRAQRLLYLAAGVLGAVAILDWVIA